MNSYEEVSIVIVSYRSKKKIINFLKKIYQYKKIIIIENSDDLTIGFEINRIYENVEVLDPNWNVTHIPEEDGQDQFYMLPTRKEDVIIRHFAGGRTWRADYFTGEEQ